MRKCNFNNPLEVQETFIYEYNDLCLCNISLSLRPWSWRPRSLFDAANQDVLHPRVPGTGHSLIV